MKKIVLFLACVSSNRGNQNIKTPYKQGTSGADCKTKDAINGLCGMYVFFIIS